MSGTQLPALNVEQADFVGPTMDMLDTSTGYETIVHTAAEALDLPEDYVQRTRQGLDLIYLREYKQARKHFEQLDEEFPGTGISAVIDTLVWQALMLENFDFRYNKQYEVSSKQAIAELEAAVKTPKHQGWTHFLLAAMKGVNAIHQVRHQKYLPALQTAFTAMDHVQKAREYAPDFVDLSLADGMYNYWRTVVTMSSKMLPDFGDNRELGIKQIQKVEKEGFFLSAPATLTLAFSWLEERNHKSAIAACEKNRARFPNNVINNLLTGQTYTYSRQHTKAIGVYNHIIKVAPENNRVHYYKGLSLMRSGKAKLALAEFTRYLQSDHLEKYQRSMTHYRLGQTYYRLREFKKSEESYRASISVDNYKPAKAALARMKKQKKDGKIQY